MSDQIQIGEKVKNSGVGAGVITGFTQRGYPQVNYVACAWIEFEDGTTFGLGPRQAPPDSGFTKNTGTGVAGDTTP